MIAAWMAYAAVVSVIFGLAGMALERSLRLARRPARWGVAAALLASIVVPAVTREAPPSAQETALVAVLIDPVTVAAKGLPSLSGLFDLGLLDLPLIGLWIGSAFLALGLIIGTQLRLLSDLRECSETVVHGVPVRRTRSFGPATVGCVRSVIVLPDWVDQLDPAAQHLTLLHEREHLRARDPQLLFAALVIAALFPWNLALWWQLRRLWNAIELDCDQRVLAAGADIRPYGSLLLRIAASRGPTRVAALALSGTTGFLHRRVRTMADHIAGSSYVKATVAALCAAALVLLGCETPSPVEVDASAEPAVVAEPDVGIPLHYEFRYDRHLAPVVEYMVTTDGIDDVLQYLRDAGVQRALARGIDVRLDLDPIIERLREEGVLQEVQQSQGPLNVLFEDATGAPQGLIRLWEEDGQRKVRLFKAISVQEGN